MANLKAEISAQDNLSSTLKNIQDELKKTGQTASGIDKIQEKFEKIQNSSAPLKRQLRDLQAIMAKMNMNGLSNTSQFTEIAEYAGKLKDAISDASNAVQKYASDTSNLDAMASAFQGISGAVSLATGAMNLFGVENEDVKEAILKVQSAMALLNGVQAIANTLNKDSALMLKLKSIQYSTDTAATTANTTAEAANTVATTANTTAEASNTTATVINTVATKANARAEVARTSVTKAATLAQKAFNIVASANPYVLLATAVAAVGAAFIAFAGDSDKATDSMKEQQESLRRLAAEHTHAQETIAKRIADTRAKFIELAVQWRNLKTEAQQLAWIENNKNAFHQLGLNIRSVTDAQEIFIRQLPRVLNVLKIQAEAAANLDLYIEQYKKRQERLANPNLGNGGSRQAPEATWRKILAGIGQYADYSSTKRQSLLADIVSEYGLKAGEDYNVISGTGVGDTYFEQITTLTKKGEEKLKKITTDAARERARIRENEEDASMKTYLRAYEERTRIAEKERSEIPQMYDPSSTRNPYNISSVGAKNQKTTVSKETKAAVKKEADKAKQEIKVGLEALEEQKKLLTESRNKLIDTATGQVLAGKQNEFDKLTQKLTDVNKKIETANKLLNPETKEEEIGTLVDQLNAEISEYKKEQGKLQEIVNDKIVIKDQARFDELAELIKAKSEQAKQAQKLLDDATTDIEIEIESGSIKALQDQIANLQDQLASKNLDINARIEISDRIDDIQRQIDEKTNGKVSISVTPEPTYIKAGSTEDLRQSYSNASAIINQISDDFQNGIIKTRKEAKASVEAVNEQLLKLGLKPIKIHFETDWEKQMDLINGSFQGIDSIISAADSIEALSKAVKEGKSDWEIFKNAVSATETVLNSINTVIQTAQLLQEAFNTTKAVSASISASDAAATEAATLAQQTKAGTDSESVISTTASTTALKAQEAAYLDMAAAAIYAAHASIPFVGVGLSSGFVTTMMSAMAAQHAASKALVAFKDGGIVGGSMYHGDKIIARLNSGEMVLNKHQQAMLFKAIDSGAIGMRTSESQEITFKLKGSDIYGSLKNFTGVKSKSSNIKSL